MNTGMIAGEWERFRAEAVAGEASPRQLRDLRKTFFAGAFAFYFWREDILSDPLTNDRQKKEQLAELGQEALRLAVEVVAED